MSKIFYPTAEKLRYLLESIHNREIAFPDFHADHIPDGCEGTDHIFRGRNNFSSK